ncbi:hypothetical protein E1269_27145 [Jiangella asiatica]|uniref:Uncharacterized protein n=1 Tax=Jiangella asiatica TaxID=2530372 RepID=A0A4R5CJC4_9ACTN|nr:hypothetical protein [Jiangella asiatica]TDD99935.1 hypothetical protein E1269_27145 [Jiangella asiatica]
MPAVYLEHNTPGGGAVTTRHPLADQSEIPIVHVTHFNNVIWDNGMAPATVVENGILDPGYKYTGELERTGVVVNGMHLARAAEAGPGDSAVRRRSGRGA